MGDVHILGSSRQDENEDDDRGGGRRIYVTNFFSMGHLVPHGGTFEVKPLPHDSLKSYFEGKRIDVFIVPDVQYMKDVAMNELRQGRAPAGGEAENEDAFCHSIELCVKQRTECGIIRQATRPKPLQVNKKIVYLQLFSELTDLGLKVGDVWWEITPREVKSKEPTIALA